MFLLTNLLIALAAAAQLVPAQSATRTVLRSVSLDATDHTTAIIAIEASGPLPLPHVGVLDGPPRVYLDFEGVTRAATGTPLQPDGLVRRVRVGDFQVTPLITRVVIDLVAPSAHRLDVSQRNQGRVVIVITPGTSGVLQPAAAARDNAIALAALGQLERVRPLLSAIDSRTEMPEASLRGAMGELETVRLSLVSIRSDRSREALTKICMLGTSAITLRLEAQQSGDANSAWNAASAAAGALIMLDRAARELRMAPVPE